MVLPQGFIDNIRVLIPGSSDDFIKAMESPAEVSLKINRRKISSVEETGYAEAEAVKWCRSGWYLPCRPQFTLNPLLHAGTFYVQDASSMIHETIVERIMPMAFDTSRSPAVLDLCAAPGGKTTSVINAVPDGTLVVANEFNPQRAKALRENLLKWGYPDIIVTNSPVGRLAEAGPAFDIVIVDAPCSGEGMMRKEAVAVEQWSPGLIRQCAELQREILDAACRLLKPGGFLVYSTCTFNREENEQQVDRLVAEYAMVPFDPGFPEEWGIMPGIGTEFPCFRFMPHATRGEGLFVAVMRKEEDAEERVTTLPKLKEFLAAKTRIIADGIPRESLKGKVPAPTSESALACDFNATEWSAADVDEATALSFLRHEALRLPDDTPRGYVVIRYKGHPLGFVKNIGNRANNLYPSDWRIRFL